MVRMRLFLVDEISTGGGAWQRDDVELPAVPRKGETIDIGDYGGGDDGFEGDVTGIRYIIPPAGAAWVEVNVASNHVVDGLLSDLLEKSGFKRVG